MAWGRVKRLHWVEDWDESIIPTLKAAAHGHNRVEDWKLLVMLLGTTGRFEEVISVLDQAKPAFESEGQLPDWLHLRVQTFLLLGLHDEAEHLLSDANLPIVDKHLLLRMSKELMARDSGDYVTLASWLETEWRKGRLEGGLWEVAKAKTKASDNDFIVKNADEIFKEVPTTGAMHLISGAFMQLGLAKEGLAWVEANQTQMPNGEPPIEVQRFVLMWKLHLGKSGESLRLAQAMAQKSKNWMDSANLGTLAAQLGDQSKLLEAVSSLIANDETPPNYLIEFAKITLPHSPTQARKMLEKGVLGLHPGKHGFLEALELSRELKDFNIEQLLYKQLHTEPSPAVEGVYGLEDSLIKLRDGFENCQDLWKRYLSGELPLHAVAAEADPLPLIWDRIFHSETRSGAPPTFLHHGGRGPQAQIPTEPGLYLDLTGLLSGWHLNIMDQTVAHWKKLHIPLIAVNALNTAAHGLKHDARHHEATQIIVDLATRGKIKVVASPDKEPALEIDGKRLTRPHAMLRRLQAS